MGSGWTVVAEGGLRRVLGQDPRLNSGDLEMGRTHMWARAHKRTHKNLDIDSGLGIIQPDGEVRYFSSFNNSLVMAPEVGSSCFRGFLLKKDQPS